MIGTIKIKDSKDEALIIHEIKNITLLFAKKSKTFSCGKVIFEKR